MILNLFGMTRLWHDQTVHASPLSEDPDLRHVFLSMKMHAYNLNPPSRVCRPDRKIFSVRGNVTFKEQILHQTPKSCLRARLSSGENMLILYISFMEVLLYRTVPNRKYQLAIPMVPFPALVWDSYTNRVNVLSYIL